MRRPNGDAADTDTAPLTTLVARLTPGAPALVRQSIAAARVVEESEFGYLVFATRNPAIRYDN